MGIVKLPHFDLYWSSDLIFDNKFVKNIMTKNKFLSILSNMHFNNNDTPVKNSKFIKIEPLITLLDNKFNKYNNPSGGFYIDESIVRF